MVVFIVFNQWVVVFSERRPKRLGTLLFAQTAVVIGCRAMRIFKETCFATSDRPVRVRTCAYPGCGQAGEYRAPKSRERLTDYYFFCIDHVREYNKAWDFFAGLSPEEIETYMRAATVWERPSWPLGGRGGPAEERALKDKVFRDIFGDEPQTAKQESASCSLAEREALAVLELVPPVDYAVIKGRYRKLVKAHHPDMNGGKKENEEKFKNISLAFATLRRIYAEEGA